MKLRWVALLGLTSVLAWGAPRRVVKTVTVEEVDAGDEVSESVETVTKKKEKSPFIGSIELLGRAGLYSINIDGAVSPYVRLGIGLEFLPTWGMSDGSPVVIPLYGMAYFNPGSKKRFYGTAGLTVVPSAGEFAMMVGPGFEYQSTEDFVFRISPYLVIPSGASTVQPWIGTSFGVAF